MTIYTHALIINVITLVLLLVSINCSKTLTECLSLKKAKFIAYWLILTVIAVGARLIQFIVETIC